MILRFVLWNLADSKTTIQELRRYLRDESADAFADVPGLRFKAWISDEVTERWGAVASLTGPLYPLPWCPNGPKRRFYKCLKDEMFGECRPFGKAG